jgi:hypothetical protein
MFFASRRAGSLGIALNGGGPVAAIWGWFWVAIMTMTVVSHPCLQALHRACRVLMTVRAALLATLHVSCRQAVLIRRHAQPKLAAVLDVCVQCNTPFHFPDHNGDIPGAICGKSACLLAPGHCDG